MNKIFCVIALSLFVFSFAQQRKSLKLKHYKVVSLSDELRETSGLTWLKGRLYTFNDGGNPQEFYEINPKTGTVTNVHKVDFPNKDWEAITNDGENIYIADIGNNSGKRKDLSIYKVNENQSERISFEYAEQVDYQPKKDKHNFDSEAIIFKNSKIHLFTKEWLSKRTSHYIIDPENRDLQKIKKIENFPIKMLVTDVAYSDGKLYLVGYNKKASAFLFIFEEDENGLFFNKKYTKYRLGSVLKYGQIEGVTVNEEGVFISGETFKKMGLNAKPSLYFIPHYKL